MRKTYNNININKNLKNLEEFECYMFDTKVTSRGR